MNKLLALSAVWLVSLGTLPARTPAPSGPSAQRLTGEGLCQVHYDETSRVDRATITRSTGSALLDQATVESAKKYWRGLPNSTVVIPVKYTTVPVSPAGSGVLRYQTPLPPYPYSAQAAGVQGSGIVQVLFDAQGKPETARMAKSTGSKDLDDQTVRYAQAHWRSTGGEEGTMTLPINYRLVPHQRSGTEGFRGSTGSNIHRVDSDAVRPVVTS